MKCPVCNIDTGKEPQSCETCGYSELEDVLFLTKDELAAYMRRLKDYRAAWTSLESVLLAQLRTYGLDWRKLENWERIWTQAQPSAAEIGRGWRDTYGLAERIWERLEAGRPGDDEAEVAPVQTEAESAHSEAQELPLSESIERLRRWVADLPDGEADMESWVRFLDSLEGAQDFSLLERLRDEELRRQFDSFETVSTDARGNLSGRRRKRVKQFVEKLGGGVELQLLRIPGGEFRMGADGYPFEQPLHTVSVRGFHLGKHPVTQAQWRAVACLPRVGVGLGEDDSHFKGDTLPAECVSRAEAAEFCARLSAQTGRRYRLPSEAEWEYACRAGSVEPFAFGPTLPAAVANYDGGLPYGGAPGGIFRRQTVNVGSLGVANGFGLCDMHGNISEWCADEWHDTYEGAPADGSAWVGGDEPVYGVARGGAWAHGAEVCRASDRVRECADPGVKLYYLGFRVALDL